jgi:hypothetical protein
VSQGLPMADALEIRVVFGDALNLLEETLRGLRFERPAFNSVQDRLKWITALLGYGVYGSGKAIACLFDGDLGRQLPGFVRAQFEASVKMAYVEHFPDSSIDFLDIEPFERWFLASERSTLDPALRRVVEHDCLIVINRRPELVSQDPNSASILAGTATPNFREIYRKLQLPGVSTMIDQLNGLDPGWNRDLYAVMFRLGSLGTHSSIGQLRDAFVEGPTGVSFEISQSWDGAPDYLLQAANYLIGFTYKVADRFGRFDDELQNKLKPVFDKHQDLAQKLGAIK